MTEKPKKPLSLKKQDARIKALKADGELNRMHIVILQAYQDIYT